MAASLRGAGHVVVSTREDEVTQIDIEPYLAQIEAVGPQVLPASSARLTVLAGIHDYRRERFTLVDVSAQSEPNHLNSLWP